MATQYRYQQDNPSAAGSLPMNPAAPDGGGGPDSLFQRFHDMRALPAGQRKPGLENVDMTLLPSPARMMQRQAGGQMGQGSPGSVANYASPFHAPGGNPDDPNGANTGPKSENYGVMRRGGINPATGLPYDHIAIDANGKATGGYGGFEQAVEASQNSRARAGMSVPYSGAPNGIDRSFDRTPAGMVAGMTAGAAQPASMAGVTDGGMDPRVRMNARDGRDIPGVAPALPTQSVGAAPAAQPSPQVAAQPQPAIDPSRNYGDVAKDAGARVFEQPPATPDNSANYGQRNADSIKATFRQIMRPFTQELTPKDPVLDQISSLDYQLGAYTDKTSPRYQAKVKERNDLMASRGQPAPQPAPRAPQPAQRPPSARPTSFWQDPFNEMFDPAAARTTSPTQAFKTQMKQGKPTQVAANVFTRPRNLSMRNGYLPA